MGDPGVSNGHTVNYRYQKDSGGGITINLQVDLYQGGTLIAGQTHNDIPNGWTAGTFTLSSGEADSITNYSDLRLVFTPSTTGGGAGRSAQVSWAEFQTPDAPVSRSYTDTWTFVESYSADQTFIRSHSDTWTFVETYQADQTFTRNYADTWTFVESYTKSIARDYTDTWTFVETFDADRSNLAYTDTWIFVENYNATKMGVAATSDTWTFIETFDTFKPFKPGGKYIWFVVNPPTESRLGGVYALDCGPGFYVQGLYSNGTMICTALPP